MTRKTLHIALAAATLLFAAAQAPAQADTGFKALAGIEAEPLNAAEMEATQGKLVPCVSEICGGAGGFFSGSPFAGQPVVGPSSSGFILDDVAGAYPWVWQPLFPGFAPGSGGISGIDAALGAQLGTIDSTLGMAGLSLNGLLNPFGGF